jgi:hypothetical protein
MKTLTHLLLVLSFGCTVEPTEPADQGSILAPKAEAPTKDDGALIGISIEIQDYQVFHPFSRTRALLEHGSAAPAKNKRAKRGKAKAKDSFGAGLVVDATNTSPHLLSAPDLLGEFVMKGVHGSIRCELDPKRTRRGQGTNHLSKDPTSTNPWRDESKQTYERVWRPGETIRLRVREDCGNFFAYDTDLQEITTSFVVEARSMLSPGNRDLSYPLSSPDAPLVRSETTILSLPPASVMLQKVQIGDDWAYSAGDVVISWSGEQVVRSTLGSLGQRADTLTRSDLDTELPKAQAAFDDLHFAASATTLTHWADAEDISKGLRRLEVQAQLSLDGAGIEARMSKRIDASSPRAEAAISKGIAAETARLSAVLPCGRIALVTTKREINPSNSDEAAGACSALSVDAPAALRLRYRLGRYEVPVGLLLRTRSGQRFVPIANQALIGFDPR